MILVDYIQCIKYSIFNISIEFQDIKFLSKLEGKNQAFVTMF